MNPAPQPLVNDLDTLASLLVRELERGSMLNAYLCAAGLTQIADDHLHAEIYPLERAADWLDGRLPPLGRLAARAATAAANSIRAARAHLPSMRRLRSWRRELAELVERLADTQAGGLPDAAPGEGMRARAAALLGGLAELPEGIRRAVLRLPACFHGFDQQPADLAELVKRFAEQHPNRHRALLVVGVRTSGSYLAPLCAAALRAQGYEDVHVLTVRPGRALLRPERELVRSIANRGGLALVTDDPPVTGASVAKATRQLERAGLPPGAIILLLQVFGASTVAPPALKDHEAVLLPSSRWAVSAKLTPAAVKRALSTFVEPETSVLAADPVPLPGPQPTRGHVRALFRVELRHAATGERTEKEVLVEGVGLGFLGAHAVPANRELERFAPGTLGLEDGLLYREWLPDGWRVGSVAPDDEKSLATAVAAYVSKRRHVLPAADDLSLRMGGEEPAWEVASLTLSRAFGRAWPLAKVALTDRAAKRVLRVERPSIVDGNTDLGQWFDPDGSRRSLVKVNVGENVFSNFGLGCYDAAFDLAGVTARTTSPSLARRLRQAHAQLEDEEIDEERWLLYELAHLWGHGRTQPETDPQLRRARSRALQRYFGDVYLADVTTLPSGPLCALDIDGVLETEQLGFPALTPAGALALRALLLHGYQPVLATGRSLSEVVDRCRAYRLAGGVAEYGAVSYESRTEQVRELLPDGAATRLERLRAALRGMNGVEVDDVYRLSVRAFEVEGGHRVGLRREAIAAALALAGVDDIRTLEGEGQTDFVAAGVNKGGGVRSLAAQLDRSGQPDGGRPLALAVGDTAADAPLAPLAAKAFAPAHAPAALRGAGFEPTSRPYQAGLAQAVGELIGHPPGTCDTCRMPRPTTERRLLLTLLAAPERGRLGMVLQALKLASRVA